eukprot:2312049-Prymnesium_polylepis.2
MPPTRARPEDPVLRTARDDAPIVCPVRSRLLTAAARPIRLLPDCHTRSGDGTHTGGGRIGMFSGASSGAVASTRRARLPGASGVAAIAATAFESLSSDS